MTDASPPPQRPGYVAFLRDFVDIDRPLDQVCKQLGGDGNWLVPLAGRAADDGATHNVRLSPSSARRRLGVPAKVRLDRCTEHGDTVLIPIRWEATTLSGLFPILDGNLELHALGTNACRLVLSASYRPPLDTVGEWLDRMAFHRVAESTVRSFLELVASSLGEGAAELGEGATEHGGAAPDTRDEWAVRDLGWS